LRCAWASGVEGEGAGHLSEPHQGGAGDHQHRPWFFGLRDKPSFAGGRDLSDPRSISSSAFGSMALVGSSNINVEALRKKPRASANFYHSPGCACGEIV
jgi:hypothetical protein